MSEPCAVNIRRATMSDLHTVVTFNAALARETENRTLNVQILQSGVEALLQDPSKGWYAVAETSRDCGHLVVVGQILVTFEWSDWRNGNFWWLQSVYVHPDYRQKGIFRQLYDYVHTQTHMNPGNICGLRLYVEGTNYEAQQAYANLGFQQTAYHMYEKEFLSSPVPKSIS